MGRIGQPPVFRQNELTEGAEVPVAGHGAGRKGHEHLEPLQIRLAPSGEIDLCRGNGLRTPAELELLHIAEDGLVELLGDGAGDLVPLIRCHVGMQA